MGPHNLSVYGVFRLLLVDCEVILRLFTQQNEITWEKIEQL